MLELEDVSVTYRPDTPDEVQALCNLSLNSPAGEFICIVGSNGSGKSTLVGVLAGTVRPDHGAIRVDGLDVTREPVHRRARVVARVFDDPRAGTAPELSIEENLALAMARGRRRRLRSAITSARRDELRDALSTLGLGLEDRLRQPVGLLSAGQRQSLTLVMAALCRPSILLLDEHLAALDPTTAERVLDLTKDLARRSGSTTVMVTHDMQVALGTGDRLLIMRAGRIAADVRGPQRQRLEVPTLVDMLRHGPVMPTATR